MIKLKEADSDYIKIGNMILPKNAANYGYADFDTIARDTKRRYDKEKDDERKEKERQQRIELSKDFYNKFMEIYTENKNKDIDDLMSALFNEFVPSSGSCDNLGAELIRAVERIRYRDYNDGDRFYEGYGLETCSSDAAFIAENTNDDIYETIVDIADNYNDSDSEYTNRLNLLAKNVVNYIKDTPDIAALPTEDSRSFNSDLIDEWTANSKHYEFDVEIPYDIRDFIDRGHIDYDDVRDFIDNLTSYYGGTLNDWASDAYTIEELSQDEYDEWERNCYREFDSWYDELVDEYGEYDEDEEDEDY
jgi:hypothetical protein